MARVTSKCLEQYPVYDIKDLKDPIIFVVDMVNGFVKEGALHDPAIGGIVSNIQRLLEETGCRSIFIADSHPFKAREFGSFPVHCVSGTSESDVMEELQPYVTELFHKNSTNAFHCPDFQKFLPHLPAYKNIIITGCCSDICILQFALTLQAWLNEHDYFDISIIVPIDMIDTYHIDGIHDAVTENEFSIRNMSASGIQVVKTMERGKHDE